MKRECYLPKHLFLLWLLISSLIVSGLGLTSSAQEPKQEPKQKLNGDSDGDEWLLIKKIEVEGNKNYPEEVILNIIKTKSGEKASTDRIREDVKQIYNLGAYADIQVKSESFEDGLRLTYLLVERPKLKGEVKIEGNDKIQRKRIKNLLSIAPDQFFSEKLLWNDVRKILDMYQSEGYYLATVEPKVVANDADNSVQLALQINEGDRVKVEKIEITGNLETPDRKLKKVMETKVGKKFNDDAFERDLSKIILYYRERGYMEAEVLDSKRDFTPDKTGIQIAINLKEGTQYRIDNYNISIKNEESKPLLNKKKILKLLELQEGDIFNEAKFQQDLAKIRQAYLDKGYILAQVENVEKKYRPEEGLMDINLELKEGRVVFIDNVEIEGLQKTKKEVINRELSRLDIKPGEEFNVKNIQKARQEIITLGSFIRDVNFMPKESDDPEKKNLLVDIEELTRTGIFSLGGGYGTESGLFGVAEVGNNNLMGKAMAVHLKGEIGVRERQNAQLRFSTPWIFNTPTSLHLDLFHINRLRRYYRNYTADTKDQYEYVDRRSGASATVGRHVTKDLDLSARIKDESVSYQVRNITNLPTNLSSRPRETRSLTIFLTRDTRSFISSMFDPKEGSILDVSYEYSGGFLGAKNKFQKYSYEGSVFIPTWWELVLAIHTQASYLKAKSDINQIYYLLFERFFLGGIGTAYGDLRGYRDYIITPPTNQSFGGNKMSLLNIEYRFPIKDTLRGVLFFDAGQVWDDGESPFDRLNFKKGIGLGVRFEMLGMLARLEYGFPLDEPKVRGKAGEFHFSLGPSF